MELNDYMEQGVTLLKERVGRYYLHNAAGRRFLASFIPALARSAKLRRRRERQGGPVPMFLICSVTSRCNLHCAGCYARAGGLCSDAAVGRQLEAGEWRAVFQQAAQLGVSFILLAGGEPLLRRDVLEAAAELPNLAFPVFTNGTLLDADYLELFDAHRNLIPVLSVEGDAAATDARRGQGIAGQLEQTMAELKQRGILYAVSVTVTSDNLRSVATLAFLDGLRQQGCGILFLVEYVPAQPGTEHLALSAEEADWLNGQVARFRNSLRDVCLFSFPGDEQFTAGCLAAGRGFFHINPYGGAEPCPFSPYSSLNVRSSSLRDVLASPFFAEARRIGGAETEHQGGCTLFRHEEEIRRLCAGK